MESSARWRKGFKGKRVMSFYRAPKPSPAQYSGKVKPAPAATASVGYVVSEYPVYQVPTSPVPPLREKVQTLRADTLREYGVRADGEENVDKMAASYIARMQERFRLEQGD